MTVKQLTVLTGNTAYHLSSVLSFLSAESVDIRAHCLVDNGDGNCKLRMVVSDPEKAVEILNGKRIAAVVNDVVMLETDDRPGALSRMLDVFEKSEMQIEYTYTAATEIPGRAVMIFRFSDNAEAVEVLEKSNVKIFGTR